jgi:hypothetical protein
MFPRLLIRFGYLDSQLRKITPTTATRNGRGSPEHWDLLARPKGFEPLTSAFGGQRLWIFLCLPEISLNLHPDIM